MSYKSVREILNSVFDSNNQALRDATETWILPGKPERMA